MINNHTVTRREFLQSLPVVGLATVVPVLDRNGYNTPTRPIEQDGPPQPESLFIPPPTDEIRYNIEELSQPFWIKEENRHNPDFVQPFENRPISLLNIESSISQAIGTTVKTKVDKDGKVIVVIPIHEAGIQDDRFLLGHIVVPKNTFIEYLKDSLYSQSQMEAEAARKRELGCLVPSAIVIVLGMAIALRNRGRPGIPGKRETAVQNPPGKTQPESDPLSQRQSLNIDLSFKNLPPDRMLETKSLLQLAYPFPELPVEYSASLQEIHEIIRDFAYGQGNLSPEEIKVLIDAHRSQF